MAVGADEFSMKTDGIFILKADGTFGIGPECCCCCDGCDSGSLASSYAVTFSSDFDHANSARAVTDDCLPTGSFPYAANGSVSWDYVLPKNTPDGVTNPCEVFGALGVNFSGAPGNPYARMPILSNGVLLYGIRLFGPSGPWPCKWMFQVRMWVCCSASYDGWVAPYLLYAKDCSNSTSPAGTYRLYAFSMHPCAAIETFTIPDTITIA